MSYVILGKDYHRSAGQKERGTCGNTVSVRKGTLEAATLSILRHGLLTNNHAILFATEFNRALEHLSAQRENRSSQDAERLLIVTRELENLAANLLAGVISSTLSTLLQTRETEKAALEARLANAHASAVKPTAAILPHPALMRRFQDKVEALRETLNDELVRGEAAEILATLIESVMIHLGGAHGSEAEVVAKVSDLMAFATNDNAAREGGDRKLWKKAQKNRLGLS